MFLSSQTFHWLIRILQGIPLPGKLQERYTKECAAVFLGLLVSAENWTECAGQSCFVHLWHLGGRGRWWDRLYTKLILMTANALTFQELGNLTIQAFALLPLCCLPLECTFTSLLIIIFLKRWRRENKSGKTKLNSIHCKHMGVGEARGE